MIENPVDMNDPKTRWDRERLADQVVRVVAQIPSMAIPLVLCFWGSRGIGKTTLLDTIRLSNTLRSNILGVWDASAMSMTVLAQEISSRVAQSSEQKKLILIDNLDALLHQDNGAAFFDFEHQVIRALVERNDTLVIVTSQSELRQWREIEVRTRLQSFQIQAYQVDAIKTFGSYSAQQIYALTLGHPQAIQWLMDAPELDEQAIARQAEEYFFRNLPEQTQRVARISCLFPVFDVAVLRLVLESDTENDNASFYTRFLERIRDLARAGLVFWSADSGSYRYTDSAVRRLCARAVYYDQPDEFKRIHQIAADYFQSDALRSAYLHLSLVSAIYHLAQTHVSEEKEMVGKYCLEWVRTYAPQWIGANWDAVLSAWETGQGDASLIEELYLLMGVQAFSEITKTLRAARHNAAKVLNNPPKPN